MQQATARAENGSVAADKGNLQVDIANVADAQNTIKSQLKSVYRKLGVDNRADAVTVGRSAGLIG